MTLIYDNQTYTSANRASDIEINVSLEAIDASIFYQDAIRLRRTTARMPHFVNALLTPTHAFRPSARNGPLSYNQGVGHHREMERRVYLGGGRALILLLVFGLTDEQNERKITSVLSCGVP